MNMLCWNVNRLSKKRRQGVLQYLQAADPDVICLQELTESGIDFLVPLLREQGYGCFFSGSDGTLARPLHVMTAVRGRTGAVRDPRWSVSSHGHQHLLVEYEELLIANTHVPNASGNGRKTKQEHFSFLMNIMGDLRDRPALICGDLNSPKSESGGTYLGWDASLPICTEHQFWTGLRGFGFRDAVIETNGSEHGFISHVNSRGPTRRYDHLLVSKHIQVIGKVEYDTRSNVLSGLSDHAPLQAVIASV